MGAKSYEYKGERMTSEDKAQEIAELEGELKQAIQSYAIIADERHALQRKILEIRIKIKDLDIPFEQAKLVKAKLESDLRVARATFWRLKGENL